MVTRSSVSRAVKPSVRSTIGSGGGSSGGGGTPVLTIPASLRQLLFHDNGTATEFPAYYTEEEWADHSHLLKDYSLGVGSLREKRLGYCYDFDGVNDYVTSPNPFSTSDFSIGGWVKFDVVSERILADRTPAGGIDVYMSSMKIQVYMDSDNINTSPFNSFAALSPGVWYHWFVIFEGTSITGFLNGVAGTPVSYSGNIGTRGANLEIGRYGTSYFNGSQFDIRGYSSALTADEVTYLYTNGQSGTDPGTANLVAHYPLQEESGTTAYDISGNGNHGTITNAVTSGVGSIHQPDAGVTKSYPNDAGYSRRMVFDGVNNYIQIIGMTASSGYFGACTISTKLFIVDTSSFQAVFSHGDSCYRLYIDGGVWKINGVTTAVPVTIGYKDVSVTFNGSGQATTLSVNGAVVWMGTIAAGVGPSTNFGIGARIISGISYSFFKGLIWDFAITGSAVKNFAFNGTGNTDADWVDTTGGYDGIVNGSPDNAYIPAASPTLDALGGTLTKTGRVPQYGLVKDWAWQGNGSTVYVDLGEPIIPATADFELEFCVYLSDSASPYECLLGQVNGGNAGRFDISHSLGTIRFQTAPGPSITVNANLNSWNKVNFSRTGDVVTLRVNANVGTFTLTATSLQQYQTQLLTRVATNYSDAAIGPVTITTGGLTTTYSPIPGTRNVAKLVSDGTYSIISNAVVNGVTADLYTLGNGSWRSLAVENGADWDGTSLIPAAPGAEVAANGNPINIPANKHPRSLIVDRTGGVIAPLDSAMGTDGYTAEEYDGTTTENTVDKRLVNANYSDRHGASTTDISGESYFDA